MRYSLRRESDGAGDEGPMCLGLKRMNDQEIDTIENFRPQVGYAVRVGSPYARSFSGQDWWQTTYITEILEESENKIRFKTRNSTYVWEQYS